MYTIVVADDEEELRKAIIRRIRWEEIGFLVVGEAENGIEALELVDRLEPDLLLTDIRMPFISGIELARQVREVRPATQIAFLSGFDDFTYAQQAIQYNIISYMLKPITMEDLTAELRNIKKKIDTLFFEFAQKQKESPQAEEFLLPLLLDAYQTETGAEREKKLQKTAAASGLIQSGSRVNRFVVLTATLWDGKGNNSTESGHLHAVNSILKKYIKYVSFFVEDRIVALLTATPAAFDKYLHILSDDILQSIERILGLHCCIGVSRETGALCGLHEAYRESVNAMRYANRTMSSIRYISDEEPFGGEDMEDVMNIVAQVENLIRSGSKQELEGYLDKEFAVLSRADTSREKINFLFLELLSGVCRIMYAVSDEVSDNAFAGNLFVQQLSFLDRPFPEASERFSRFCLAAADSIAQEKQKSSMDVCDRALKLIKKEYANPEISLMSVSSQIGVSPNYLSALIKKRTGKSFVDYLTQKRMEEAKEQLLHTSRKIREISESCGYNDQHYFSYCFKKFAGVSPNMLRQQTGAGTLEGI